MLDVTLIRNQILMIAEPGPLAEAVVRKVVAEAERYGQEEGAFIDKAQAARNLAPIQEAKRTLQELLRKEPE